MPDVEHVIRLRLDRRLAVVAGSVTTYEDETVTYRVSPLYGPFDTWEEVLGLCRSALDEQLSLW